MLDFVVKLILWAFMLGSVGVAGFVTWASMMQSDMTSISFKDALREGTWIYIICAVVFLLALYVNVRI